MNSVCISGNLVRDPEVKSAGSGTVCNMTVAVDHGRDKTAFVQVEAWDKTGENCGKFLAKGRSVEVEGALAMDEWTDRETGKKRSKLKVVAYRVHFGRKQAQEAQAEEPQRVEAVVEDSEDVPF